MLYEVFAREVAEAIPHVTSRMQACFHKEVAAHNVALLVRVCGTDHHAGKESWFLPSGGLFLSAQVIAPGEKYTTQARVTTARLRPGWTPEQLAQRLKHLTAQAKGLVPCDLVSARNAVYLTFEALTLTDEQSRAIDEAEKETGHTPIYDEMTLEDCAYWLEWANAHGVKQKETPA